MKNNNINPEEEENDKKTLEDELIKKDLITKNSEIVDKYIKELSNYFAKLDEGIKSIIPNCIEIIAKTIGGHE